MPLRPGLKPETLAVHAGLRTDPATGSPLVPVYRVSAFAFSGVDEMADTFAGRKDRWLYTRYGNPSIAEAEERIAALEGGEGAVAFASGTAAIHAALLAVVSAGDHVVAQQELYGGTTRMMRKVLERLGVSITWAPAAEIGRLESFLRPQTRAVYLETPTNPTLRLVDVEAVAAKARGAGAAVLVDNTFATPINQRPLALGADIVLHSATKYLAGHGDLIAGLAVASGPALRRLRDLRIDTGGCLDPEAGWVLARSLRTLPLRMRAHNANALAVAAWLERHPAVARVHYPGLASHARHDLASRQMAGFGGMLSFELGSGAEGAKRFVDGLTFVPLIPTLGGLETSVLIPAISSHSGLTAEERRLAGVSDGLVRLSVGVEDPDDLIAELDAALGGARS